jgi:hypothetical protein
MARWNAVDNSVTRMEAWPNTFTVTMRVVGGDENGSLNSETVKYGSMYKRQTRPLVREGAPQNKTVTVKQ